MPRIHLLLITSALFFIRFSHAGSTFDQYFLNANLRIDYFHSGDAEMEVVLLDRIIVYGKWAGSKVNLTDKLNYGAYYHKIYDAKSGELIYSRGFDSYFKEYQTSNAAIAGKKKVFHETALIPLPKDNIIFTLEKRSKSGQWTEVYRTEIDPNDISVIRNEGSDPQVTVINSLYNGSPSVKADIAIIGEGYTAKEKGKFEADLKRFTQVFTSMEPINSHKESFNIYGVYKPSAESGADEPRAGVYKNTLLGASFNSLGSERYLLTEDNKTLRDVASNAPYDAIYIMVNHSRYGGGGIYNFFCTFTSDNINSNYLMLHEFGHSFFGLADEYYTSSTAYTDFYTPEYEPMEPNITALKDPKNIKWKAMLSKNIEIPTPWEKEKYDEADYTWQQERKILNDSISKLQLANSPDSIILQLKEEYDTKSTARDKKAQAYLDKSKFAGKVGAFEGAGYAQKGLYRPSVNCIMFTRTNHFCPVCSHAMAQMIDWYSH